MEEAHLVISFFAIKVQSLGSHKSKIFVAMSSCEAEFMAGIETAR